MMNELDKLALRKQLLVARSALYRAHLSTRVAGGRSLASWIGTAGTVMGIARIVFSVIKMFRR